MCEGVASARVPRAGREEARAMLAACPAATQVLGTKDRERIMQPVGEWGA